MDGQVWGISYGSATATALDTSVASAADRGIEVAKRFGLGYM